MPASTPAVAFMLRNWWINHGHHDTFVARTSGPELPNGGAIASYALNDPPPPDSYDVMSAVELRDLGSERGIPITTAGKARRRAEILAMLRLNDDRTVHPLLD